MIQLLPTLGLLLMLTQPLLPEANTGAIDLIEQAATSVQEMLAEPDAEVAARLLQQSHGVIVFPSLIKGGFGIGGQLGDGVFLRRDRDTGTWYGPSFVRISGLSYGWQIGLQKTSLILVIANEQGLQNLKNSGITLGGDLSVTAGPLGRRAQLATDLSLDASLYSYSLSRGLFIGASLEGSRLQRNDELIHNYWDALASSDTIFSHPAEEEAVAPLIEALNQLLALPGD